MTTSVGIAPPDWRPTHLRRACLAGPSVEEIEAMSSVGANVIQCNLNACVTDGRTGPGILGGEDAVADFVELTHRLGAKAVGYLNTRLSNQLQAHLDWVARNPDGSPIGGETAPHACQNSPYGQYLIDQMVAATKRTPIDGWWLDCWTFGIQNCWCQTCQRRFTAEMGLPMPRGADPGDPLFASYEEWRDEAAGEFFARMHQQVQAARPGTHIWVNFSPGPANAPLPHSDAVFRMVEAPTVEQWLAFQLDNPLTVPFSIARLVGAAGGRESEVWMVPTPLQWDRTAAPDVEMMARVFTTITYGAVLQFPTSPGRNEQMRTAFDALAAREQWLLGAKPLKWAALVLSWRTPEFYGRSEALRKYYHEVMGVFRALSEEHLPVAIVTEADVEEGRLDDYAVVLVPNAACLSQKAQNQLRTYVKGGGGLVATHETSYYDPYGNRLSDLGLADLLGARVVGAEDFPGWRSDRLWFEADTTTDDELIEASKWACITSTPREWLGSVDWAGHVLNVEPVGEARVVARRNGLGNNAPTWPAEVLTTPGKGRVAYFPLELGASYYDTSYPYLRRWLLRTTLWAAGEPPPVSVQGPLCLITTYRRQSAPNRLIIHLLNDLSSTGRRPRDAAYLAIREEVLPLHNIEVSTRLPGIKRAHLEPGGMELPLRREGDRMLAVVPELLQHALVVFE